MNLFKNDKKPKTDEKQTEEVKPSINEMIDAISKVAKDEVKDNETTKEVKESNKELTESEKISMDLLKSYEKIDELTDALKRLQAEYENHRKCVEREYRRTLEYSSANIIGKLLPIIDTFNIAVNDSADDEKFKEGIKMIYNELMNILKSEGLEKIDALNKQLDPNLHDAMIAVESKGTEKDTVLEVIQEGYKLKERVLRHSKVKISK